MFRGIIYQQVFGTAMGSPVSVVVANLVMEYVEEKALSSFPQKVRFWKRYVDDVCCSLPKGAVPPFLLHLNSIQPSIQFTCEMENDHHLPFLDIFLKHNLDGSISTSVYRKPTHTDQYLDFSSHHPLSHKAAVVKTLFTRSQALTSCAVGMREEQLKILKVLKLNHYPGSFVNGVYRRSPCVPSQDRQEVKKSIVLPYIHGLSEAIRRAFSITDVRVSFQPYSTLRQLLVHVKDPTPTHQLSDVVYSIPCKSCPDVYIGQTSRSLKTRIDEHKTAVKHAKCDVSAVAEHVWMKKHDVDFQSVSVLAHECNLHKRLLLESWFIRKSSTYNREMGSLVPTYNCLF